MNTLQVTIVTALAIYVVLATVWIWLISGFSTAGYRGMLGRVALQASIVVFCFYFLRNRALDAFVTAFFPPLALIHLQWLIQMADFILQILLFAVPFAVGVFLLCVSIRVLRPWSFGVALLVLLGVSVPVGERISRHAMCEAAAEVGISQIKRNTFLWSLMNTPREFQFEIHAVIEVGERTLGWSYREMTWYDIPVTVWGEVHGDVYNCQF